MDLKNLETLANKISSSSPAIKKYALEHVRVAKDQEQRLQRLEARFASPPPLDTSKFTMNQLAARVAHLFRDIR